MFYNADLTPSPESGNEKVRVSSGQGTHNVKRTMINYQGISPMNLVLPIAIRSVFGVERFISLF
ncbi:MAG: hypothetical protein FD123_3253 [Bacteroidetes bacterium]|nr:MAG: hypothetical protein FD123_3253 [Bacteroidota bacterium]